MGQRLRQRSRSRSIAFVGLTIALIAVSAWITVPIGPVPFTLQMFSISFAVVLLTPGQAIAAICGYLLLGAIGVPVFSGMRGGIGVLLGPTGGFLWGYAIGVPLAVGFLFVMRRMLQRLQTRPSLPSRPSFPSRSRLAALAPLPFEFLAPVIFTTVAYLCGCLQYAQVMGVGLDVAFATSVAPFIIVDLVKIALAVGCARAVRLGLGLDRRPTPARQD